jgi:hypothetical protein
MIGNAAHEGGEDAVLKRSSEALPNVDFSSPHDCLEKENCEVFLQRLPGLIPKWFKLIHRLLSTWFLCNFFQRTGRGMKL